MAVANTKSTAITNADAQPSVANSPYLENGLIRESVATVEVAAADDDGSVFRMFRVPSNARISQIMFANDAITGGTAYDVGVYQTAANGGAAVDDDLFLSAVDFSSARAQYTDLAFESASRDVSEAEQRLWELLGLSADPHREYDICMTGDTVGTAAGTISGLIRYVV